VEAKVDIIERNATTKENMQGNRAERLTEDTPSATARLTKHRENVEGIRRSKKQVPMKSSLKDATSEAQFDAAGKQPSTVKKRPEDDAIKAFQRSMQRDTIEAEDIDATRRPRFRKGAPRSIRKKMTEAKFHTRNLTNPKSALFIIEDIVMPTRRALLPVADIDMLTRSPLFVTADMPTRNTLFIAVDIVMATRRLQLSTVDVDMLQRRT